MMRAAQPIVILAAIGPALAVAAVAHVAHVVSS